MTGPIPHTVDARGLNLHVLEWPATGPSQGTVVLHHGFLDHAHSWRRVAEILTAEWRVLALDARGHGRSGWIGDGGYYYFQDYVFDLLDVLDALASGERPLLVGHSMGGMVSSLFCGTFPERAAAMVSIEGAGPPAMAFEDAPELMSTWIDGVRKRRGPTARIMADAAAAAARLRQANPRLDEETATELAAYGTRPVEGGVTWHFDPMHQTRTPQPFYLAQAQAFWRRISVPTLLVRGAESPFRYPEAEQREAIDGARTIEIDGAGHMVHHEQPQALADALLEFWQRLKRN